MTLEQFVLRYVHRHRSVLPDELRDAAEAAGHRARGRFELVIGRRCLAPFVSQEFAQAVLQLLHSRRLRMRVTSRLDYLASNSWLTFGVRVLPVRLEEGDCPATAHA